VKQHPEREKTYVSETVITEAGSKMPSFYVKYMIWSTAWKEIIELNCCESSKS
jgi:hypothetical protein